MSALRGLHCWRPYPALTRGANGCAAAPQLGCSLSTSGAIAAEWIVPLLRSWVVVFIRAALQQRYGLCRCSAAGLWSFDERRYSCGMDCAAAPQLGLW